MPTSPDGDCDADGVKNGVDPDDDNDLIADGLESSRSCSTPAWATPTATASRTATSTSPRSTSTTTTTSRRTRSLPYPGKTPYPNPLYKDNELDFDGDSLSLQDEYKLWKYTYQVNLTATRTLFAALLLRWCAVLAVGARGTVTAGACRR